MWPWGSSSGSSSLQETQIRIFFPSRNTNYWTKKK